MRLSRPAVVLTSLAAVAATLGVAAPTSADDSWSVPGQASITIRGHGYGHGHGMSQYGAEGAAPNPRPGKKPQPCGGVFGYCLP